jgi:hypothetical protein
VSKFTEEEDLKYVNKVYYEYKRPEVAEDGTQTEEAKCPEVSFKLKMLF